MFDLFLLKSLCLLSLYDLLWDFFLQEYINFLYWLSYLFLIGFTSGIFWLAFLLTLLVQFVKIVISIDFQIVTKQAQLWRATTRSFCLSTCAWLIWIRVLFRVIFRNERWLLIQFYFIFLHQLIISFKTWVILQFIVLTHFKIE